MALTEETKEDVAETPAATFTTLDEKVRALRKRVNRGLRRIEPIGDLMGIAPNKVDSKPPKPIEVRPAELWVDATYQRDLSRSSMRLILRIISGWDWRKFKAPIVTTDAESRYIVIDGQHTAIAAATHPDIDRIPVMFVPMTDVQHQAQAFVAHNTSMVRVTDLDLFHANKAAGDPMAVDIDRITAKHGVSLARYVPGAAGLYDENQTVAIGTMKAMYQRYGAIRFEQIVKLLAKCGFTPIKADHIRAVAILLYDRNPGEDELSGELLVKIITSLNDTDALQNAKSISVTTRQSVGKSLAQVYRSEYWEHFTGGAKKKK